MQSAQLGISTYDNRYGSCRCVYCHEIVLLLNTTNTQTTLDALFQDEVEKLRERYGSTYYLTVCEERELRESIQARESGECIGYEQCIHYRCLAIVQQPENKQTLALIRQANRQNMPLPTEEDYVFYELHCSTVRECTNYCVYCHREINTYAPGFAYCEKKKYKLVATRKCEYMHSACFNGLTEARCHARLLEAQARRNFMHMLTVSPSSSNYPRPTEYARRNEAWLSFLSKYALDFDERHLFSQWLTLAAAEQTLWPEFDNAVWLSHITHDLNALTTELAALSEEELTLLESELLLTLPPPPQQTNCILPDAIPAPCILYKPTPLSTQLQLNLIAALRQARREQAGIIK